MSMLSSIRRLLFGVSSVALLLPILASDLPPGVPNPIGPDGKYTHAMMFTTKAYQNEALRLVLKEANSVAQELKLPEELPIADSNIVKSFINPFGYAYAKKMIGNITTKNYVYYISQGNKFSYLESPHQDELCRKFQMASTLPDSQVNTNEALKLSTTWLAKVSIDVKALKRDCSVRVEADSAYVHAPLGKFVPVYYVAWYEKTKSNCVASVRLFSPSQTLLQLRVEDSKYILRPPLVFSNLDYLLSPENPLNKN